MEPVGAVDPFIPDLKYLLDSVQYMNPVKRTCKKENKLEEEIHDFTEAYLGPQIWNNTMGEDDMKLGQVDLEELLDDSNLNKELDISLLLGPQDSAINTGQIISGTKDGIQYSAVSSPTEPLTPFSASSPQFPQFSNTVVPFNQPTTTAQLPADPALDLVLPPVSLCEVEEINSVAAEEDSPKEGEADQEMFDPRKRSFTDDELKPQPIIRKAKKVYVPEDSKDAKYWHKREKNNVAAKRSREARRIKENQIAMRTKYLEKENSNLHMEVKTLRMELQSLMAIVAKYENRDASTDATR